VPNPLPLVALPGDDAVWTATVAMSTEDAAFPASNLKTGDPAEVAKSTGTSTTITITTSSITPVAVALINTNAELASINGDPIAIPALDPDGQRKHAWMDMRGSPSGTGTSWTIVLSRASGVVWCGRIVLATAIYDLNLKYGLKRGRKRPGDIEMRTRLGSVVRYGAQIRTRWASGVVDLIENETLLAQLEASAKGSLLPFLFVPDELTNDAWFVTFTANDFVVTIPDYDVRESPLSFEELSSGPPNG